jgi:hypothetical protein
MLNFISTPLKKKMTDKEQKKAIKAFEKWYPDNIEVLNGKIEDSVSDTFGFPYTDSSSIAGLWNANTESRSTKKENAYFDGLAMAESGFTCAIFTLRDKEGGEIKTVCIAIE